MASRIIFIPCIAFLLATTLASAETTTKPTTTVVSILPLPSFTRGGDDWGYQFFGSVLSVVDAAETVYSVQDCSWLYSSVATDPGPHYSPCLPNNIVGLTVTAKPTVTEYHVATTHLIDRKSTTSTGTGEKLTMINIFERIVHISLTQACTNQPDNGKVHCSSSYTSGLEMRQTELTVYDKGAGGTATASDVSTETTKIESTQKGGTTLVDGPPNSGFWAPLTVTAGLEKLGATASDASQTTSTSTSTGGAAAPMVTRRALVAGVAVFAGGVAML